MATSVVAVTRDWLDRNGDYVPDCDLTLPLANGECGQISDLNFGRNNPRATRYDPAVLDGFGARGYNWEGSLAFQRELTGRISANVAYFRRWYGNFRVTDNLDVTPEDYDPFCITAPVDARLPGGGGNQICGYYDIKPAKFGRAQNLVTLSDTYGKRTQIYDGVDLTVGARLPNGVQLSGGASIGRVATNECAAIDSPQQQLFCDVKPPFQPNIKLINVYPLPWWGLQTSVAFQSIPGPEITAAYVATNAQIRQSLGRDLASGPTGTALLPLIKPGTMYDDRLNQLDLRVSKRFNLGWSRLMANVDVFNLFNGSGVMAINTRYGPSWLQPQPRLVQGRRFLKLSAQVDF